MRMLSETRLCASIDIDTDCKPYPLSLLEEDWQQQPRSPTALRASFWIHEVKAAAGHSAGSIEDFGKFLGAGGARTSREAIFTLMQKIHLGKKNL